jgi:hypothetical protein
VDFVISLQKDQALFVLGVTPSLADELVLEAIPSGTGRER